MNSFLHITKYFTIYFLLSCPIICHAQSSAEPLLDLYLGIPYLESPLGEGLNSAYTPKPLLREDGFDCTTYVETVLSKRKTQLNHKSFQQNLNNIRYIDGKIGFFSRAHFMESQWIPNAIKYKFILPYPITNNQYSDFKINLREWFLENDDVLLKDEAYIKQAMHQELYSKARIPFVPKKLITQDFITTLPNFMVIFFLKELPANQWIAQHQKQITITHMGLLKNHKVYHASRRHKKVMQTDLIDYLSESPSVVGVSFYKVD